MGGHRKNRGFTLIELLVAATILAVLAAIGFASYSRVSQRSRDSKRVGDLEQIRSALELFRADKGYYPSIGNGNWVTAEALDTTDPLSDIVPAFMPAIPNDPKDTDPYLYYYRATDLSGTSYYGYCLSAALESASPPQGSCTPYGQHNYGVKNP